MQWKKKINILITVLPSLFLVEFWKAKQILIIFFTKMSGVWGTTKVWSKPYSKNLFIETFSKNYFNTQWFYIQPNYSFLPVFIPNFLSLANKGQLRLYQRLKSLKMFLYAFFIRYYFANQISLPTLQVPKLCKCSTYVPDKQGAEQS